MQPRPQSLRDLREYPVLYVDDEPENLRIFELSFRRDFEIFTAESGAAGLEILQREPVALVLSDHRMPGMTGTEFLARVCQIDPKTIRIMVTAYGDAETLRDAINDGSIYHFIPKPWDPEELRATLVRGIEAYALERERAQLLREMTVINSVSRRLNDQLQPARVIEVLAGTMRDELHYDGACVLLVDPESGELRVASRASEGAASAVPFEDFSLSPETAHELFASLYSGRSQTLRLDQANYYPPAIKKWVTELAAEEVLVTPLFGKEGLIGALAVDNRSGGGTFSGDDGTLIEGLCNQASIALENARLIGELRQTRRQARRTERFGQVASLASDLAREIVEPLDAVQRFVAEAPGKRDASAEGFWSEGYAGACRDLERVQDLVLTLHNLGRAEPAPNPPETFDLRGVLAGVVSPLRREARLAGVELELSVENGLPKLVAVRDQLRRLVQNLVLNALEATPAGGSIKVEARGEGDEWLELSVSDTGPGIADEHLEQLFDPFFSTKHSDEGMGLGLLLCHRIASHHGGSIEVSGGEGEGARFAVRMPLAGPPSRD